MPRYYKLILIFLVIFLFGCSPASTTDSGQTTVGLTSTTILADIARNVAGTRLSIESILPIGADPHSFQPVPADLAEISESRLLILNGVGYEGFLEPILKNAGGQRTVIEATAGLQVRSDPELEHGMDPHMWMDPNMAIVYAQNIRDGLIEVAPQGEADYRANADAYIAELRDLNEWIEVQVSRIPANRRLLVTNHDALGYFADRYGFEIVGTLLKSVSSQASVSALELSVVVQEIRSTGVPAIFLDEVENPAIAAQVAEETGVIVVHDLHIESLTDGPPAGTYLDMMKHNVSRIVNALK